MVRIRKPSCRVGGVEGVSASTCDSLPRLHSCVAIVDFTSPCSQEDGYADRRRRRRRGIASGNLGFKGTAPERVSIRLASQHAQLAVFFDDADASWQPRRAELGLPVRKRAVDVFARRVEVVPAHASLPMETLTLVRSLFSAPKTRNLRSRRRNRRHKIPYVFGTCCNA